MIEIVEEFKYRLEKAMAIRGKKAVDVSKGTGISESVISQYRKGLISPKREKIMQIADYLNVDPVWLMGLDVPMEIVPKQKAKPFEKDENGNIIIKDSRNTHVTPRKIPVIGGVAAGIPIEMIEDIVGEEEIPGYMQGEYFGLVIHGDSMEPRIKDGDVVIVRQQSNVDNGDTVIVTINGDDATCKKIQMYEDGLALISNNPDYPPMIFNKDEVQRKPIRILGKVVELRAKF